MPTHEILLLATHAEDQTTEERLDSADAPRGAVRWHYYLARAAAASFLFPATARAETTQPHQGPLISVGACSCFLQRQEGGARQSAQLPDCLGAERNTSGAGTESSALLPVDKRLPLSLYSARFKPPPRTSALSLHAILACRTRRTACGSAGLYAETYTHYRAPYPRT
ncbi:hypothetical protein B0H17DRAFT_1209211 [Mycena rosella]|uniref:Uncharacterized protein n=1 Tax=Mycena rosella TaxID=1033263 RepID=A0AAD7CYZ3_MYCRO|nr:hypothetical protein B0H17DRAFT_1209211 [Mycena rosella]